jgi:type I restriction enzyme S subunit
MVAIRADQDKVYPKYLFAALRSPVVQARIGQMHVGTLIPHFKKGDFDKLRIPLPSKDAQVFIGDAYFDFSAKIDLNRRTSETLEGIAKALFKSWFVDFDPVRAKSQGQTDNLPDGLSLLFPDSFGDDGLPSGWGTEPLGALLRNVVERIKPSAETQTKPYVPIDAIAAKSLTGVEPKSGAQAQSSLVAFDTDDILFGAMRPYFHRSP